VASVGHGTDPLTLHISQCDSGLIETIRPRSNNGCRRPATSWGSQDRAIEPEQGRSAWRALRRECAAIAGREHTSITDGLWLADRAHMQIGLAKVAAWSAIHRLMNDESFISGPMSHCGRARAWFPSHSVRR
jgi:hypothetical protein